MENTIKPKKRISQRIAEFLFLLYVITLYIFVDRAETVIISKIVFVMFAVFTIITILRNKSIHIGKNVMTVYVAFTWMLATVFWAKNEYNATYMMKTMWQLFVQFFLVYNLFAKQPDAHEKLIKSLYIAGIVLIGYSISVYGFSEVIRMLSEEGNVRLGAEINQENSFGIMNSTTVILAFYYLLYKRRFKLFHGVVLMTAFLFSMSSGSRKALLMVFLGVIFLIFRRYKFRHMYKTLIIGALSVIIFIIVTKLPMFDFINSRMESFWSFIFGESAGDRSSNIRWNMIVDGWKAFKERVVVGHGANNYRNVLVYRTYAHNNFIEMLVDFGVVGFTLYYIIYLMAFRNLWKMKGDAPKALFAIFTIRFIMEIAFVTYYSKIHWVIMAFAMISVSSEKDKKKAPQINAEADGANSKTPLFVKKPRGREIKFLK